MRFSSWDGHGVFYPWPAGHRRQACAKIQGGALCCAHMKKEAFLRIRIAGVLWGAAMLMVSGCGKQESANPQPAENATKPNPAEAAPSSATATSLNQPAAAQPQGQPAQPASAADSSVSAANQTASNAVPTPVAGIPAVPAVSPTNTANPAAAVMQSQPLGLSQGVSNQIQGLAAGATNGLLAGLAATNQVLSTTTNQVQALLDKAKLLTSNQKYQDALATLTQLYQTKLTPEQKQQADALKTQIQNALAQKATSGAASALGDLFNSKK